MTILSKLTEEIVWFLGIVSLKSFEKQVKLRWKENDTASSTNELLNANGTN